MRAAPDAREHLYLALWSAFTRTVFEALVCRIRIRLPTEHVAVGAHGLGRGTRAHKISKTKPRTGSRRGSQLQFTTKVVACLPALVIRRERLRRVTWFTWVTRIDATSNPLTASCKRAVDDRPFSSSSWLSTLALKTRGKVQLRSRNDNDFTARYPEIAKALAPLPNEILSDGEIVALDTSGRPSFNALQNYGSSSAPRFYYVFNVLVLAGKDVTR
jgi:hypothetical protein